MNLLIADDEMAIRRGLLSLPWSQIGIEKVYEAENGIQAKEILQNSRVDIVISDIKMPGLSGLELAEYIRELNLDTAIILLTGFSDFNFAQQAIRSQVADYMLKPLRPKEILDTTARVTENLKRSRYLKKVVRQYEHDSESVDRGERLLHCFRGVNTQCMQILQDIGQNFTQDITLGSMAEKYHFSQAYLSRMIRRETGYAFSDILNSVRLEEAVSLLMEENEKVGLVCERVGFRDARYFSQVFKKVFGCTPNEFRKNVMSQRNYSIKSILETMDRKEK